MTSLPAHEGTGETWVVLVPDKLDWKPLSANAGAAPSQRYVFANENLAKAGPGIADKVKFLNQDLFETDLSEATVITLYLLPSLNQKLMPKLKALKPGTRIVSHSFDMGTAWPPEKTEDVGGRVIYYWTIK